MSKIRNPLIIPTGAVEAGFVSGAINVEQAIAIEEGTNDNEILFMFSDSNIEANPIWKMQNNTVRNTEYGLMVVPSNTWDAGTTQLPFISSSAARIVAQTGAAVTKNSAINLDKVIKMSTEDAQVVIGGPTIYSIVFTYLAVDHTPKYIKWSYAAQGDRDTVYGELHNAVAAMTFL